MTFLIYFKQVILHAMGNMAFGFQFAIVADFENWTNRYHYIQLDFKPITAAVPLEGANYI